MGWQAGHSKVKCAVAAMVTLVVIGTFAVAFLYGDSSANENITIGYVLCIIVCYVFPRKYIRI